jgi:hypothetical protein
VKMATLARRMAGVLSICVSTAAVSGEIFIDSVKSAALGRDLNFTVYLPDGYKEAPGKFPVVYLLHHQARPSCINRWSMKPEQSVCEATVPLRVTLPWPCPWSVSSRSSWSTRRAAEMT